MAWKLGRVFGVLLLLWFASRALTGISGAPASGNARLDAEIQYALETTGVYVPPRSRPLAHQRRDALGAARVNTLACLSKRSNETIQFLDALRKSEGVRNPASDPWKSDRVHVAAGMHIAVDDWGGDVGLR